MASAHLFSLLVWPDVVPALEALKDANVRLAFLSNLTPKMLQAGIATSHLTGMFEHVLSTDSVKTYKPDPHAYQLGVDAFGRKREEILFVAFAGWNAAGAKACGCPTFWVNRQNLPREELGVIPDGTGADLAQLIKFVFR